MSRLRVRVVRWREFRCLVCRKWRRCRLDVRPHLTCSAACKAKRDVLLRRAIGHETGRRVRRACDPVLVHCSVCHGAKKCPTCGTVLVE